MNYSKKSVSSGYPKNIKERVFMVGKGILAR
jgi:hypothetical protein